MCNGTPFTVEKISPRAVLELGTARSVGQRLTHLASGAAFYDPFGRAPLSSEGSIQEVTHKLSLMEEFAENKVYSFI